MDKLAHPILIALSYLLFANVQILPAQNFIEIPKGPRFSFSDRGSIIFGDVDGDNDQDIFLTGGGLYINQGQGEYAPSSESFPFLYRADAAFVDLDNDGDLDLMYAGSNFGGQSPQTNFYINDGKGSYTLNSTDWSTRAGGFPSIAFGDIDGDNDEDLILAVMQAGFSEVYVYQNDQPGFKQISNPSLKIEASAKLKLVDVDADNDLDLFITRPAALYLNDGNGSFSLKDSTNIFQSGAEATVTAGDIDGDNDTDLIISGGFINFNTGTQVNNLHTIIYKNDGIGNFTAVGSNPLTPMWKGDILISDLDGDQDQDIVLTGNDAQEQPLLQMLKNDGSGNFSPFNNLFIPKVGNSAIGVADIDNDGDNDLMFGGDYELPQATAINNAFLLENEGQGTFIRKKTNAFNYTAPLTSGDLDGDGDPDIIFGDGRVYINDGTGHFDINFNLAFDTRRGDVALADLNGDNKPEIIGVKGNNSITNQPERDSTLILALAEGSKDLDTVSYTALPAARRGEIGLGDLDGDGDLDVVINGERPDQSSFIKFLKNNGNFDFSEYNAGPIVPTKFGQMKFADLDGDGDLDFLQTGLNTVTFFYEAHVFFNDGTGNYTEDTTELIGYWEAFMGLEDTDGDGDLDLYLSGRVDRRPGPGPESMGASLYKNDGNGHFVLYQDSIFEGLDQGNAAFADMDLDGDADLVVAGRDYTSRPKAIIYENDGVGNYSLYSDSLIKGAVNAEIVFRDMDWDRDPDLLIVGRDTTWGNQVSYFYHNNLIIANNEPLFQAVPEPIIYPNPSSDGNFIIRIEPHSHSSLEVMLADMSGQLLAVQQHELLPGEQELPLALPNLPAGIYLVRLTDGKHTWVRRLVIGK